MNKLVAFTGSTATPALDQFYIITNKEDKLKIYAGIFDEKMHLYYNARNMDDDVQQLFDKTNSPGKKARSKDKDLRTLWDYLDEVANRAKPTTSEAKSYAVN